MIEVEDTCITGDNTRVLHFVVGVNVTVWIELFFPFVIVTIHKVIKLINTRIIHGSLCLVSNVVKHCALRDGNVESSTIVDLLIIEITRLC